MARRYLFSDESGDLQFRRSPNVSKYFAVGTLLIEERALGVLRQEMASLRDELAWRHQGLDSAFHATTDAYDVRNEVFSLLERLNFRFDITLFEKSKAMPRVRPDAATAFRYAWYFHLKYLAPRVFVRGDQVLVVAASLGTRRERKAFRTAIEDVMTQCVNYRVKRTLAFWRDESDFGLQAVDYCTWAVMRKYERGDDQHYNQIREKIGTEFDLFATGTKHWY